MTLDFFRLTVNVTRVFDLNLDLLGHGGVERRIIEATTIKPCQAHQLRITDIRASQQVCERILSLYALA